MAIDNIDRFGNCIYCHRNLKIERVVDSKVITMFTPEHSETQFLLDDGSRMRVCICKTCKSGIDLSDKKVQAQIMEAVVEGWKLEVKGLVEDPDRPDWDEAKGKRHMEVYSKKTIDLHSEGIDDHVIKERKEKVRKMLEEDVKRVEAEVLTKEKDGKD